MDAVASITTDILRSMLPTLQTYGLLHEANRTAILSTPKTTFKYGPHFRHEVDVYTPPTIDPSTPILLYLYGGGLERGDRTMPSPPCAEGLVYANIAHYFCSKGYMTIIPDYRRIKPNNSEDCAFPSGAEDLDLVLGWLHNSISNSTTAASEGNAFPIPQFTSPRTLFLAGHSAGAVHIATWLLHPSARFATSRQLVTRSSHSTNDTQSSETHTSLNGRSNAGGSVMSLKLHGVILISMPAHFGDPDPSRLPILKGYYGDRLEEDSPLGLVSSSDAQPQSLLNGVSVLVVNGTREPDAEINDPTRAWLDAAKRRWGASVVVEASEEETERAGRGDEAEQGGKGERLVFTQVQGHNHFSHIMGLGTGVEGEEGLGTVMVEWMSGR